MAPKWIGLVIGFGILTGATAHPGNLNSQVIAADCEGSGPVLDKTIGTFGWGSWPLPINSTEPQHMTEAIAKVTLIRPVGQKPWQADVVMAYPPGGWAIPYTFEKIQVQWASTGQVQTTTLDWSSDCQMLGPSITPGHPFEVLVNLKGSEGAVLLRNTGFRVWGQQS